MKDASGSSHMKCYAQSRPSAVSRKREPSVTGSPPPHRKRLLPRAQHSRPSAARFIEHNTVLWPEPVGPVTLAALLALAPGQQPASAPVPPASFTPGLYEKKVVSTGNFWTPLPLSARVLKPDGPHPTPSRPPPSPLA